MTAKRRAEVGDDEVQEMMTLLLARPYGRGLTPEARAATAYDFVLSYAKGTGASNEHAKVVAEKVCQRILWTKVPGTE